VLDRYSDRRCPEAVVCLCCVGRGPLPALATSSDQIDLVRFGHSVAGLKVPWRAWFFQRDRSSAGLILGGVKLVCFVVVQYHAMPAVIKYVRST
jgi:hypothetical protein